MVTFRKSQYFYLDQREYVGTNVTDFSVDGKTGFGGGFPMGLNVGQSGIGLDALTMSGTSDGSLIYSEPFRGDGYKKVIVYADGYENTTATAQTLTFPTPFTYGNYTVENGTGMTITVSNTGIEFPVSMTAAATDGFIIIEGI